MALRAALMLSVAKTRPQGQRTCATKDSASPSMKNHTLCGFLKRKTRHAKSSVTSATSTATAAKTTQTSLSLATAPMVSARPIVSTKRLPRTVSATGMALHAALQLTAVRMQAQAKRASAMKVSVSPSTLKYSTMISVAQSTVPRARMPQNAALMGSGRTLTMYQLVHPRIKPVSLRRNPRKLSTKLVATGTDFHARITLTAAKT